MQHGVAPQEGEQTVPVVGCHAGSVQPGPLPHEPLHPFAATADACTEAQLGVHPRRPVAAPARPMDVDDGVGQVGVVQSPVRHRVGSQA